MRSDYNRPGFKKQLGKQLMKYRFPSDVKKQLAAATRSPPRVRECESLHTEPDTLHR